LFVSFVSPSAVVAAFGKLRDMLQGDVGVATQVLKALVGHVVIQKQHFDGYENPQMFARFTIYAVPALAAIGQSNQPDGNDASPSLWGYLHGDLGGTAAPAAGSQIEIVVPLKGNRGSDGSEQTP